MLDFIKKSAKIIKHKRLYKNKKGKLKCEEKILKYCTQRFHS